MTTKLNCDTSDIASVRAAFPDGEAMVYGFSHCHYKAVNRALARKNLNTYNFRLGKEPSTRPGGRPIYQINSGQNEADGSPPIRACKAALVNMVLENYKSQKTGVPIVPIVFCIDVQDNLCPLSPANIASKTIINPVISVKPIPNKITTHCELRIASKLCIHPDIQDVAQKSFKCVKVTPLGSGDFQLSEVDAPWKSPDWDAAWAARKSHSMPATPKEHNWRKEVSDFVHRQDHRGPLLSRM
jgi:hypothetical protein